MNPAGSEPAITASEWP